MYENKDDDETLLLLTTDYCNKYQETLLKRTLFIQTLMAADDSTFNTTCLDYLSMTSGLNEWFDPIDPMVSISENEICELHQRLFLALKSKGITSLSEYVSFSYLITLDLYLNANQQQDYENCVNSFAWDTPKTYCNDLMDTNPVMVLWDDNAKSDICVEVSSLVTENCEGLDYCDACAIGLADIYQTYEKYVNSLFAYIF